LVRCISVFFTQTPLGRFGAESMKNIHLFSNFSFVIEINDYVLKTPREARECSKSLVVRTKDDIDPSRTKVRGGEQLKPSENYPILFGAQISALYSKHVDTVRKEGPARFTIDTSIVLSIDVVFGQADDCDTWPGAKLDTVFFKAMRLVRRSALR